MNKTEIHGNYMEDLKRQHAWKSYPNQHSVLLTGDKRKGSIGECIRHNLKALSHQVESFTGDVRDRADLNSHHTALVMCHGITHLDWLEGQTSLQVDETIDVNLTGSIKMVQSFVNATLKSETKKAIIMIGSMAHNNVLNGSSVYCASKAGLNMFARCAAWELAPKGYDVFIINPSNTEGTPMTEDTIQGLQRYRGLSRGEAEAYWGAVLPRAKWLQPDDIADLVMFLLSGDGSYLSGATLDMPGGQR